MHYLDVRKKRFPKEFEEDIKKKTKKKSLKREKTGKRLLLENQEDKENNSLNFSNSLTER